MSTETIVSKDTSSTLVYDEQWYLEKNQDIAEAVARGDWISGYAHYCAVGKPRGRQAVPQIDEAWYFKAYPLAVQEISMGKARTCLEHYLNFGRYRGYLTDRNARRPANAAAFRSRFGGLWTDQANALDLVAGRLDLGKITQDDAELLDGWIRDGFVILKGAIDEDTLQRTQTDLDKAYDGNMPNLKFAVHGVGQRIDWVPEAKSKPTKALDIHWFSAATRDLIFAPQVLNFLHLVFERRALASSDVGLFERFCSGRASRIRHMSITLYLCNSSPHGSR